MPITPIPSLHSRWPRRGDRCAGANDGLSPRGISVSHLHANKAAEVICCRSGSRRRHNQIVARPRNSLFDVEEGLTCIGTARCGRRCIHACGCPDGASRGPGSCFIASEGPGLSLRTFQEHAAVRWRWLIAWGCPDGASRGPGSFAGLPVQAAGVQMLSWSPCPSNPRPTARPARSRQPDWLALHAAAQLSSPGRSASSGYRFTGPGGRKHGGDSIPAADS